MDSTFCKQLTLFDIQSYEYNLLISPPRKVIDKVFSFKKLLNDIVQISKRDLYSTPHISLLKLLYTDSDRLIIFLLKQALRHSKKFQIELNGVGRFDNKTSNTIYVNIANPEPVISIHETLMSTFGCRRQKLIPHLTIARGILNSDVDKLRYTIPHYQEHFCCNTITILKKPVGNIQENIRYTKIYEMLLH